MPKFWGNKTASKKQSQVAPPKHDTSPVDNILSVHQSALLELAENEKYECRVHDFSAQAISLTAPLDDLGHPILIPADTQVRVVLQADKRFYGFNTKVIAPRLVNNTPLLDIAKPRNMEHTDRREYYRVPVDLPIEYRLIGEDNFRSGRAVDISGGGVLCVFPRNVTLENGAELDIHLALPTTNFVIEARAVVRKTAEPLLRSDNRRVSCEFTEILPRTREAIIRYVAKRQLELIRAGVL